MRRSLLILGIVLAALLAAAALVPWWLGFALAHAGPRFGLTIRRYERNGYGRFTVYGIDFRRGPVHVWIERATASTPLLWLAHNLAGAPDPVVAGRWSTVVVAEGAQARPATPRGWVPLRERLRLIADRLDRWLPVAEAGSGTVTWPSGELTFASVRWAKRTVTTPEIGYRILRAAVTASFPTEGTIHATARDEAHDLTASLQAEGSKVAGELGWSGQRAAVDAVFGPAGWAPGEAHLRADHWDLPAARLRLGAEYAQLRGTGSVDWSAGALTADVSMQGEPRAGTPAPPVALRLHGAWRNGLFLVEQLEADLPGIKAHLTEPVAIDRTGRLRSAPSRFVVEAELAQQPWATARGRLRGEGRISPGVAQGIARIDFSIAGDAPAIGSAQIAHADAAGTFEWPRLQFRTVHLRASDGSEVSGTGGWDFRGRELIAASVRGILSRGLVARWIPAEVGFKTVAFEAAASGRWPNLEHHGQLETAQLDLPKIVPLRVSARWNGTGATIARLEATATGAKVAVAAAGSADLSGLRVANLSLRENGGATLELAQPFSLRWRPHLESGPLQLVGGDTRIAAAWRWGPTGSVDVDASRITSGWLGGFMAIPAAAWSINSFRLQGHWDRGPAIYTARAVIALPLGGDRAALLAAELRGDGQGTEIRSLRASEGEGAIVTATGRVPLVFRPGQRPLVELRENGPFALEAVTTANPGFWEKLTEVSGVEIVQPEARVHLGGTLAQPRGDAEFRAVRIAPVPGRFKWKWPKIEQVDLRVTGARDGVRVDSFSVALDGQAVRADGWVPVTAEHWAELLRDPRLLAEHGDVHVQVPDADLSAIAQYVPAYLAPSGRLELDLLLKSDRTVNGYVRIRGATSRPLGPLGVLQEVSADVRFEGRTVRLQDVTARMGGQLVTLRGQADLPEYRKPRLDFTLQGQNLPFVRRTGLLVRGDLDLTLKTLADGPTEIGGQVRLRDSLFLEDLRSFLPSGAKGGGGLRPPYFSIEMPPLNAWRLAVTVHGDRFMRFRTPVFNGTASANFRLDGLLASPRVTGEAVIDEGTIRLPFASFDVHQGEVRLTADQAEPQLMVIGTARHYGYDLRLELTGPVSAPILTFSSSPPLESEQVLLMVMAGEAPHNEVATSDRQRAARFGAFFGQSLLGSFGGGAGGADRLTISSGEDISAQGRETYSIEYRLNNRWSLTGEYDEFDEYIGGVKWRVYQKGGRR